MPVPADLSGNNANKHLAVWNGNINVSTGNNNRVKNKNFFAYIEIFEQTAHDAGLRALAQQRGIQPRRAHDGQVNPDNDGTNNVNYYAVHGEEASKMAAEWITSKWTETVGGNANYWVRGKRQTLTWQAKVRPTTNHSYEVTLWYEGTDIYVAFHCYEQ